MHSQPRSKVTVRNSGRCRASSLCLPSRSENLLSSVVANLYLFHPLPHIAVISSGPEGLAHISRLPIRALLHSALSLAVGAASLGASGGGRTSLSLAGAVLDESAPVTPVARGVAFGVAGGVACVLAIGGVFAGGDCIGIPAPEDVGGELAQGPIRLAGALFWLRGCLLSSGSGSSGSYLEMGRLPSFSVAK